MGTESARLISSVDTSSSYFETRPKSLMVAPLKVIIKAHEKLQHLYFLHYDVFKMQFSPSQLRSSSAKRNQHVSKVRSLKKPKNQTAQFFKRKPSLVVSFAKQWLAEISEKTDQTKPNDVRSNHFSIICSIA